MSGIGVKGWCPRPHFDLFVCGSFNSDSQIISEFWRFREEPNGLDLDDIIGRALKKGRMNFESWVTVIYTKNN
jgi:hypothetical protein